ncbi:MAG: hypothetical protein M1569_03465 [Candidatus Marsarchaeota archaeon]|nr:hypothetical protein [Candidatus Marsarchaeota archaeon]MCL5413435.1 hypothetical protein [Candidatus Marsarchaeota archaeon]
MTRLSKNISEPSILVKPVSRFGGLDNIHIALMILVVILILLLVVMSYNTKITVINATTNGTAAMTPAITNTIHNASQVRLYAERVLAGFSDLNSSISLLPFISNVSDMNISYVPSLKEWYVTFPYALPANKSKSYLYSFMVRDSNLSLAGVFSQGITPPSVGQDYVISPGVIKIAHQTSCSFGKPLQVYWFVDPYAPGGIPSLVTAENLQNRFGGRINITIKPLFTQYSSAVANTYGLNNTLALEKYLLCGENQKNFSGFIHSVNASYSGTYMPAYIIKGIAEQSGFNMPSLASCISSSQEVINNQVVVAKYYNITSSSSVVTDCQYLSIPETAQQAICYANSTLC